MINPSASVGTKIHNNFPLTAVVSILPLAFLWFILINHLRVEWTLNPQYSYGWAVPFLCAYLLWRNYYFPKNETCIAANAKFSSAIFYFSLAVFALLYVPTRLIQEANPDWRLISWTLAVEVVGITLSVLSLAFRSSRFHPSQFHFAAFFFPICFFLVAVPWPTALEQGLIQGLTRADASLTTELLGWVGVPAMPHGNVIEVATGEVGIDEACSGIRSFQATLMISLFLGEFYRLNVSRRLILIAAGFAMSFLFNLVRMSLLVWIAAHQGIPAIAKWHDPAGVTILVACFLGLWGAGEWLQKIERRKNKPTGEHPNAKPEFLKSEKGAPVFTSAHRNLFLTLIGWIVIVEISVECWYRAHETRLPAGQKWTAVWPTNQPTFKELSIPTASRQILRYDEGRSGAWQQDNFQWQGIFLRWNPGSAAQHLAQNHTPEICLTAAGHQLISMPGLHWFDVNGLHLPFLVYQLTDTAQPFYVFYCLWDDRANVQGFETASLTWGSRLAPVLAGVRNPGQRSLEIAVTGNMDEPQAEDALQKELQKIIQKEPGLNAGGEMN